MDTDKVTRLSRAFDTICAQESPTPEEAAADGAFIVKKALEHEPDNSKRAALRHVIDEAMKMATEKWRALVK